MKMLKLSIMSPWGKSENACAIHLTSISGDRRAEFSLGRSFVQSLDVKTIGSLLHTELSSPWREILVVNQIQINQ